MGGRKWEEGGRREMKKLGRTTDKEASILTDNIFLIIVTLPRHSTGAGMKKE